MRELNASIKEFEFGLVDKDSNVTNKLTIDMVVPLYKDEYQADLYRTVRGIIISGELEDFGTPVALSYRGGYEVLLNSETGLMTCELADERKGFDVLPCDGTDMEIFNKKKDLIVDTLKDHTLIGGTVHYEVIGGFNTNSHYLTKGK